MGIFELACLAESTPPGLNASSTVTTRTSPAQVGSPNPLSVCTQPENIFLYILAFFFLSEEVQWMVFRLARLDQVIGETVREHLFFLPQPIDTLNLMAAYEHLPQRFNHVTPQQRHLANPGEVLLEKFLNH